MKKFFLCSLVLITLLAHSSFLSAQVVVTDSVIAEITATFHSLFNALSQGDLQTFKSSLSSEEYARYKVLFEQNRDYPAFLRNFYRGTSLRVGQIDSVRGAANDVIAEFIIDFPSGETNSTSMRLTRDDQGMWKVKKILADKYDQGEPPGENRR